MPTPFDPRKTLKQISNSLLKEYFSRRGELVDVPWDDLRDRDVEPVFHAIQALPDEKRTEVHLLLRDVADLATTPARVVLGEEVAFRAPDRRPELDAQPGLHAAAMWAYLHVRSAFDEAVHLARALALRGGLGWERGIGLPRIPLTQIEVKGKALGNALATHYSETQGRGRRCHVTHHQRCDGTHFFFAHLDDFAKSGLFFEDGKGEPTPLHGRPAFENYFAFNPTDGSLEVYARGGKAVLEPIQMAFCTTVLGVSERPKVVTGPCYQLDHLRSANFPLPTDPDDGVEDARIVRLRLVPIAGAGHVEIKADPRAERGDIYQKMERWLKLDRLPATAFRVSQATFTIRFVKCGPGRQARCTFDVTVPSTCNLKNMPDERRAVAERCLKRWGVAVDT